MTTATVTKCGRCGGSGDVLHMTSNDGAVCYGCGGTGLRGLENLAPRAAAIAVVSNLLPFIDDTVATTREAKAGTAWAWALRAGDAEVTARAKNAILSVRAMGRAKARGTWQGPVRAA
jgi:uncharacterized paraquat-inducible protein A